jgi:pyruvate dehydrogenase E2 component (dihydrolipoamide acetyltransferase)
LTDSKQQVPHYYLTIDLQMDALLALRERLNQAGGYFIVVVAKLGVCHKISCWFLGKGSYKLSVNDFLVKASAFALMKVPAVNSSWRGDFIRQFHNADVSFAVRTDNGLITPIVQNANVLGACLLIGFVSIFIGSIEF